MRIGTSKPSAPQQTTTASDDADWDLQEVVKLIERGSGPQAGVKIGISLKCTGVSEDRDFGRVWLLHEPFSLSAYICSRADYLFSRTANSLSSSASHLIRDPQALSSDISARAWHEDMESTK